MDKRTTALAVIARIAGRDVATVEPRHDLVADLDVDSPKALQLLVELEEALGVEISDEDAAKLDSVGDILGYVERLG